MKVGVDTNVFLNVIRNEVDFADSSTKFLELHDVFEIVLSVITLTEIFRGAFREEQKERLDAFFHVLKARPIPVTSDPAIEAARLIELSNVKFADALIAASMRFAGVSVFVTRNKKDFRNTGLEILTPEEFLSKYR